MIKSQELTDPKSCMSRAHDDEMTFNATRPHKHGKAI